MTEIVKDEKQFSVEVVNRLVTQKMITFNDEEKKYVITKEGKKFRKYMLENSGIDIDEKLEWINKKMQGYIINFMDAENNDYRGGTAWDVYHKKCLPEELKKASLLEISEYFTKLDCNSLAVHIVKQHFEKEQAELIYKFKCGDPANINFTSIVIDYDKSQSVVLQ